MRQVDRATVDMPPRLSGDLAAAIEAVRQGQDARNDIYGHDDVVLRLKRLYLEKCYLCERELKFDGVVEHFLPWHKTYPERAYTWANLHWSCNDCNQRKKQGPYRVPAQRNRAAERTDLIDPSAPPTGKTVADLLEFNPLTLCAVAREPGLPVASNTEKFLNEPMPYRLRVVQRERMAEAIIDADCKRIWQEIADLPTIDVGTWDDSQHARRMDALRRADGIYETYLHEGAPFAVSMRVAVHRMVGLSADDFRRMSDAYRRHRKLPPAPP